MYLKGAYFSIPLNRASTKFVWFIWAGKLYQFLCFCSGIGTCTENFYQVNKNICDSIMSNILNIESLDVMINWTLQEANRLFFSVIVLLQQLGFVFNLTIWSNEISLNSDIENRVFRNVDSTSITLPKGFIKGESVESSNAMPRIIQKTQVSILESTKLKVFCLPQFRKYYQHKWIFYIYKNDISKDWRDTFHTTSNFD